MDLKLSDDQRMIRESADSVLADVASSAQTRLAMTAPGAYDAAVWQRLASELGWCAIPIPEKFGGLGLGAIEQVQLFEAMGRHLLCAPYFATVALAVPLLLSLASNAAQQKWLPPIAEGRLRATAPMVADSSDEVSSTSLKLRANRHGNEWRLDGSVARLIDGASAQLLLLPASIGDNITAWFAVETAQSGLRAVEREAWDLTRRFAEIELDQVVAHRIDEPSDKTSASPAIAMARLCLAAEQLGGAQACLDMSVAYTATRKQFGRSIAGFQAIKHRCAQMMVEVEALRSTVYGTAALFSNSQTEQDCPTEAALTLALAKETYFQCAQEAIQLHGGVGFTWEYDPQLHLKRAQAGSHWMGTASVLRARLADELMV
jgi:alkylation response protein AidB-like acyl-CoA dehydrogenase